MSKRIKYVQCSMQRPVAGGTQRTTSYIPLQFARLGKSVKLKDEAGEWTNGWVVKCVGDMIVAHEDLPDYRKAIRMHRKTSGDSAPRLNKQS